MVAENLVVSVSGLVGFTEADRAVSCVILLAKSGLTYIPIACDSSGKLITTP